MTPLSFTDEELNSLTNLASALPVPMRGGFLECVAAKLAIHAPELRGPGLVHRLGIEAQKEFLRGGMIAVGVSPKFRRGKYA
jgi:hypothetical protein